MATRAITIDAPAGAVWPWLAQMGPSPRGGAYTYDWIENLLGLDMHSADRVLPDFQHPELGDTIGFGSNRMRLARVEPHRVLSWRSDDGNWVWTFCFDGHDGRRGSQPQPLQAADARARLGMLPMEPASLVMERKMLLESRSGLSASRPTGRMPLMSESKKTFTTEEAHPPRAHGGAGQARVVE